MKPLEPVALVCACANLRRATRAVSRLYEECLAPVDLSSTQMTLVMFLSRSGPTLLTELAGALAMDRTSLYRALRPLEKRLLVRVRGTADRRAKEAILTKDGERLLASAMPHWQRAQKKFLDAFGAAAWEKVQDALTRAVAVTDRIS
jgi:DNA-binding MarR family transcriptional regulator